MEIDHSTGEVKQCVKSDAVESDKKCVKKNDKETGNKGTEYTDKDLERVTRKCLIIENGVGTKKMRLDKISSEVKMLSHKKSALDTKIADAEKEYRVLDCKGVELNSADFRQKCFLLCNIAETINERCKINKQLADYSLETSRLNKEMYECERAYKTNVYLKEKIMIFFKKN